MLKMISWSQLIEATLALAGIYYLVVSVLYFRREIKALLKGEKPGKKGAGNKSNPAGKGSSPAANSDAPADDTPQEFLLTEKIVAELKKVIEKVIRDGVEREDLLRSIARVLEPHGSLENTPYGIAINNFIIRECASMYSVHLDEREV